MKAKPLSAEGDEVNAVPPQPSSWVPVQASAAPNRGDRSPTAKVCQLSLLESYSRPDVPPAQ